MSKRSDKLLLGDITEAASKILDYTNGLSFDSFANDSKTVDAVIRNFEIIGEATNRLSDSLKQSHPEIDWRNMVGLRNKLIHDYIGVDLFIVWHIIQMDMPKLLKDIELVEQTTLE